MVGSDGEGWRKQHRRGHTVGGTCGSRGSPVHVALDVALAKEHGTHGIDRQSLKAAKRTILKSAFSVPGT